jgi:hypothetical protein
MSGLKIIILVVKRYEARYQDTGLVFGYDEDLQLLRTYLQLRNALDKLTTWKITLSHSVLKG